MVTVATLIMAVHVVAVSVLAVLCVRTMGSGAWKIGMWRGLEVSFSRTCIHVSEPHKPLNSSSA
jgi:hypothetical protein